MSAQLSIHPTPYPTHLSCCHAIPDGVITVLISIKVCLYDARAEKTGNWKLTTSQQFQEQKAGVVCCQGIPSVGKKENVQNHCVWFCYSPQSCIELFFKQKGPESSSPIRLENDAGLMSPIQCVRAQRDCLTKQRLLLLPSFCPVLKMYKNRDKSHWLFVNTTICTRVGAKLFLTKGQRSGVLVLHNFGHTVQRQRRSLQKQKSHGDTHPGEHQLRKSSETRYHISGRRCSPEGANSQVWWTRKKTRWWWFLRHKNDFWLATSLMKVQPQNNDFSLGIDFVLSACSAQLCQLSWFSEAIEGRKSDVTFVCHQSRQSSLCDDAHGSDMNVENFVVISKLALHERFSMTHSSVVDLQYTGTDCWKKTMVCGTKKMNKLTLASVCCIEFSESESAVSGTWSVDPEATRWVTTKVSPKRPDHWTASLSHPPGANMSPRHTSLQWIEKPEVIRVCVDLPVSRTIRFI